MTKPVPPPRRVLFITRKWSPAVGGMETYSMELVAHLREVSDLALVALPGRANGSPPGPFALMSFGIFAAWKALSLSRKIDVIHAADLAIWPFLLVARIANPRARLVISGHGTDVALAMRTGLVARIYRTYVVVGAKLLPNLKVLANSSATAKLARDLGYKTIYVIRLAATPQIKAELPSGSPDSYILFVGRLIQSKGLSWFVRNVLPRLKPHIRLKVAGTVVDAQEAEILSDPRVDYLGPMFGNALAQLRQRALTIVVPNLDIGPNCFEGFGLTAVEGAMDGGVVLASRVYGLTDAVIDASTGFLLPAGDADAWSSKIETIAEWSNEQRQRFLEKSSQVVRLEFNWSRVAAETLAAYR